MSRSWIAIAASILICSGCEAEQAQQTPQSEVSPPAPPAATPPAEPDAQPIPLRIPINAVMAGIVNRASFNIFQTATADSALSEADWLGVGASAIDLVGAATLTTIPGTGPNDAAWVSDPKWLELSMEMRDAGMAVGQAAASQNQPALSEASARLAQSCQSCHLEFSPRLVTSQPPQ